MLWCFDSRAGCDEGYLKHVVHVAVASIVCNVYIYIRVSSLHLSRIVAAILSYLPSLVVLWRVHTIDMSSLIYRQGVAFANWQLHVCFLRAIYVVVFLPSNPQHPHQTAALHFYNGLTSAIACLMHLVFQNR